MSDASERLIAIEGAILELMKERAALLRDDPGLAGYAHERRVLESVAGWSAELGADTEALADALVRIDAQVVASTATDESDTTAADAGTALVIGGGGRMGGWMARFLTAGGWRVTVADPAGSPDGLPAIDDWRGDRLDQDLIVVAAPLRPSNAILHELASRRPTGIVFDIGSLKSPLRSGLTALRDAGVRATSVHPMYGPDVELLHGRHVILVDLGDAAATDAAESLFAHTAATRVRMTLDEHDRVIAYILGLSHALNIAFVTAMAESGEAAPRLADMSSSTFEAQLGVARRVVRENPHLYFEIQHLNDYGTEALAALSYAVEKVRSVVRAGDEPGFVRLMEQGNTYVRGR